MKKVRFLVMVLFIPSMAFLQENGSIQGHVKDSISGEILTGATIALLPSVQSTLTDEKGFFSIPNLKSGTYQITVSFVGYSQKRVTVVVLEGSFVYQPILLNKNVFSFAGDNVVITASKHPEKLINAPSSISLIQQQQLAQFAGSNVGEMFAYVSGIEYIRTGVDQMTINARGFNSAFNPKFLQLIDGRNTMSPGSGGLPLGNNATAIKEDIESIEFILGPQSALYGPNAHNGLLNIITKDPRKYTGTTVGVSAGSQYQFSTRLRQAAVISKKWAYKMSGEYATGKELNFVDSVYAGGPGVGPVVAIPERNVDYNFRHIRGEAHVYYSVTDKLDFIISGGGSKNHFLQVTNTGRNQMRGLSYSFLQAKIVHPRFSISVCNAWGTLGTSYSIYSYTRDFWNLTHRMINPLSADSAEKVALKPGNQFKEENQRLNAEGQYNFDFSKIGLKLVAGLSYQKDKPHSFGYTLLDLNKRIYITQWGAVLQAEQLLSWDLKLTAASRFDHHSSFGNFVAPKFALVKRMGNQAIRISWAKAYSMPSILFQYSNILGLVFGNGKGIAYIPNNTKYSDSSRHMKMTVPLVPEAIQTWEIGYRGSPLKKMFFDFTAYYGKTNNFLSSSINIDGQARNANNISLKPTFPGVVTNDTLRNARFSTYFNYGEVHAYGIDFSATYTYNKFLRITLQYSWFGSDITKADLKNDANKDGIVANDERSLNAPQNRASIWFAFQNLWNTNLFINAGARYVQSYDFYSGNQIGTAAGKGKRGIVFRQPLTPIDKNYDYGALGGFTTIDINAGYKANENLSLGVNITNVFNIEQQEFVGCPPIPRLFSVELKMHIPSKKNSLKK